MDVVITVIAVILVIMLWIMLYDSNRFVVRHYPLRDQRIKKSVKAVVLADLHNKRYGKENERLLQAIDEIGPDMILIAGDMLTAKPKATLDVAVGFLTELAKKYPVYYGNGNHEHRLKLYPENYGDMAGRYEEALTKIGIHRLVNEHKDLPEYGIRIYGSEIDRLYYKRFGIQPMDPEYLPGIFNASLVDEVLDIHQRDAENTMRELAVREGIFCGVSSGGAVAGALRGAKARPGVIRSCPRRHGESSFLGKGCGVSQCETFSKIRWRRVYHREEQNALKQRTGNAHDPDPAVQSGRDLRSGAYAG